MHVPLNDHVLCSPRPSALWGVTQHTWSVALTTVEGIFWWKNGSGVSEDTVQPYQFEPESDPEQDDGPEEVRQLRLEQDVSEWLVNVMSL